MQSFESHSGMDLLSHDVPYFLFVHEWHSRGLPGADISRGESGHVRTAGRSIKISRTNRGKICTYSNDVCEEFFVCT
jgi:hypothetical protein